MEATVFVANWSSLLWVIIEPKGLHLCRHQHGSPKWNSGYTNIASLRNGCSRYVFSVKNSWKTLGTACNSLDFVPWMFTSVLRMTYKLEAPPRNLQQSLQWSLRVVNSNGVLLCGEQEIGGRDSYNCIYLHSVYVDQKSYPFDGRSWWRRNRFAAVLQFL